MKAFVKPCSMATGILRQQRVIVSLHDSDFVQSILYKLTMMRLQKWTAYGIDQHTATLTILILQDSKWQASVSLVEF